MLKRPTTATPTTMAKAKAGSPAGPSPGPDPGKAAGKQQKKTSATASGGFLLKSADKKEEPHGGKFVIPKILLERGPTKPADVSARVMDTGAYETLSVLETGVAKPKARPTGIPDEPPSQPLSRPRDVPDRGASRRSPLPSVIGDRGGPGSAPRGSAPRGRSPMDESSLRSGPDVSERKLRRRIIRALINSDEYVDPPCCPRTCLLAGLWVIAIVVITLLLKFMMQVDLREITIIQRDADSCFGKVYLV